MKRIHIFTGAVLFLFATYVTWDSMQLSYYTPLGPGPGFFALWLGILLMVLSVVLIIQATRSGSCVLPANFFPDWDGGKKIAVVFAAVTGVAMVIEWLGFPLTMLVMYLAVLYGLGRRDFLVTTTVALIGSFGVYFVFTRFLSVPLPAGVFFD